MGDYPRSVMLNRLPGMARWIDVHKCWDGTYDIGSPAIYKLKVNGGRCEIYDLNNLNGFPVETLSSSDVMW